MTTCCLNIYKTKSNLLYCTYMTVQNPEEGGEETPSPTLITQSKLVNKRVALNVGGVR